jgi:superfamily I DNA/RNA helicase
MEKYGIMTPKEFKEMTLAVARGEYKLPTDAPKQYFEDQETADRYFREGGTMNLTTEQLTAAHAEGKSICIRAVSGSGKTEMLMERVRHLTEDRGFAPHDILCCTFTRMAAQEIQARLAEKIGSSAARICAGTIHSTALAAIQSASETRYSIVNAQEEKLLFKMAAIESGAMRGYSASKWAIPKKACADILENYYQTGDRPMRFTDGFLFFETFMSMCNRNRSLTYGMILPHLWHKLPLFQSRLRFRHILVDEVQDIDTIQWRVFAALQHLTDADLFVVGDPCQSIFSFRGSLPEYPEVNRDKFTMMEMHSNFRSAQAIVTAANRLMKNMCTEMKAERGFDGEVVFGSGKDSHDTAEFTADLLTFTSWKPQDIAILARNHVFLEKIRQELGKLNIPCAYHAADNLEKTPGFLKMHNLLKLLVNPYDNFAFMQVHDLLCDDMQYPQIRHLAEARGQSLFQVWKGRNEWSDSRYAQEFFNMYTDDPPVPAVAFSLKEFGDVPAQVIDLLFSWCVTAGSQNSVSCFLDWLAVRESEGRKTGGDAVHLLTIHAAKGLQWPVVIVAGVNEGILPSFQSIREGEQAVAEERRLMYVALTRAMDSAFIFSRPEESEKWHNPVSRFVKEMQ